MGFIVLPAAQSGNGLPQQLAHLTGPLTSHPPQNRHEDIIELLTGERQTGDLDPVEETIDDPNFGGVWGNFEGGIVVAVLDWPKVAANELARIAGGAELLHLIETPHTFNRVAALQDSLTQELRDLGIAGEVRTDSTSTGRTIVVGVLDPAALPADFGATIPDDGFRVTQIESLDSEE